MAQAERRWASGHELRAGKRFEECFGANFERIRFLAPKYAQAREAMVRHRGALAKALAPPAFDERVVLLVELNIELDEPQRNVPLFLKWRSEGASDEELEQIHRIVWSDLAKAGKYESAVMFDENILYSLNYGVSISRVTQSRSILLDFLADYVEALAALGRNEDAVKASVEFCASEAERSILAERAIKVQNSELAQELEAAACRAISEQPPL